MSEQQTAEEKSAARWADAVEAFERGQRAAGLRQATIVRQVKHVRRFARWFGGSPWHVTAEDVFGWLDEATEDASSATRASMRSSLRAFYRWAVKSGRMTDDPTAEESRRGLRVPVPDAWAQPLVAYQRHLQARGLSPLSVRAYVDQLRTFARENPSLEPWAVTVDDIYEWQAGKTWARETRRARRMALRSFYEWAVETGRMDASPAATLPRVRAGDPVARPALDAEYEAAMEKAREPWGLAIRISAEMGLRREEVSRIHSADMVQGEDGQWWLTVHGKGGKTRVLPVPGPLARVLRDKPEGYVFPGQIVEKQRHKGQGHVSARWLGKQVAACLPDGVTMHALRHRFATRAYNVDRDVFTVQKLLGHASAATTQRYVKVSDQRMRKLVEAVL